MTIERLGVTSKTTCTECREEKATLLIEITDDLFLCPKCAASLLHLLQTHVMKCSKCKSTYTDLPALSRDDDKSAICPKCGMQEAVDAYSVAHKGDTPKLATF